MERARQREKNLAWTTIRRKETRVMEEQGYEFLINIKWPHEGFTVGYDIITHTEEEPYNSVLIYLGFITLIYNWY